MKTVYDIQFKDWKSISVFYKHFKPRLPWHPLDASVNTYFEDWTSQQATRLKITDNSLRITATKKEISFPHYKDGEKTYQYQSAEIVGKKSFQTGRFEVVADMNPQVGIVPAIWFLTQTRFVHGDESIKPEWDSHEFGTEHEPILMNIALHDGLHYPTGRHKSKKFYNLYTGVNLYWTEIEKRWLVSGINDRTLVRFRRPKGVQRQPMYPIIWSAVPYWGGIEKDHTITINRIKLDV